MRTKGLSVLAATISVMVCIQVIAADKTDSLQSAPAMMDANGKVAWYDAKRLGIEGRGWNPEQYEEDYDRLPAKAKAVVRPDVWKMGKASAGESIRFMTDSDVIRVKWELASDTLENHIMSKTSYSGVDLYMRTSQGWQMVGINGKIISYPLNEAVLASGLGRTAREYRLYLPLYNGVKSVEIGIGKDAFIRPAPALDKKPVCFYGSSIVQGASASRPGMTYPAVLGRNLDMPIVNIGFAGNAKMEPEIARLLAEVDAAVYVIDPLANMLAGEVDERYVPFIKILRQTRPDVPIVLIEPTNYVFANQLTALNKRVGGVIKSFRAAYKQLVSENKDNLYMITRESMISGLDGTSDGTHPTDLGFSYMVSAVEPVLRKIVEGDEVKHKVSAADTPTEKAPAFFDKWQTGTFHCDGEEIAYVLARPDKPGEKSPLCLFPRFTEKEILDQGVLNDLAARLVQHGVTVVSFQSKWADLRLQSEALKKGTDTFAETDQRIRRVLDACLKSEFYSGGKIILTGASRYGFAALHATANDPRIDAAVALLPVTYWPFLSEFKGMERNMIIRQHDLAAMAEKFAPRDLFIEVASDDTRVSTEMAMELTELFKRRYADAGKPEALKVILSPSKGHGWRGMMNEDVIQWLNTRGYISK